MSNSMILGGFVGLVLVLAVVLVARSKLSRGDFDERQLLLRGQAYQMAFLSVLVLAGVHGIIVTFSDSPIMEDGVGSILIIFVGIMVFAVESILRDAFFTVKSKPVPYLVICGICVASGLLGGISNLRAGTVIQNGLLTTDCFPLAQAVVFLVVLLTILWKNFLRKEREE